MLMLLIFLCLTIKMGSSVDHMPCTDAVTNADLALAERILRASTPNGYRLVSHEAVSQTGRSPHRWRCRFQRVDNRYSTDCDYLTEVRTSFKRDSPVGCEVSQISISTNQTGQYVGVEFLVNCGCRKVPRRRRRSAKSEGHGSNINGFVTEHAICTGMYRKY